jgi:O-methyltransferase/macrocin O-methyltransferase/8-demethyl-8-(2,3-dimethoxy-alpha-L-rhamnosyl)tetracenomycin-C 4'-O-methyltransferase
MNRDLHRVHPVIYVMIGLPIGAFLTAHFAAPGGFSLPASTRQARVFHNAPGTCIGGGTQNDAPGGPLRAEHALFRISLAKAASINAEGPPLDALAFSYSPVATRYLQLMEGALLGTLFSDQVGKCGGGPGGCALSHVLPFVASDRLGGNDWPPVGHTMVGGLRLRNVREAIEMAVRLDIPGDFVELGVWRGGTCIYARALFSLLCQDNRDVLVFDAFENIPGYGGHTDFLSVSEERVRRAFDTYGVGLEGVRFFKGLFRDTLRPFREARLASGRKSIAVLRIDGNFYDSYQDAFYALYDLVPVGGVVIMDDYTHPTCQAAWADFQADQGFRETVSRIAEPDANGGFFIKTHSILVDQGKVRPSRDVNLGKR